MSEPSVPILMYHSISSPRGTDLDPFCVDPSLFDEQLAALGEGGWQTLTVAELTQRFDKGDPVPERTLVITFDDGYADFHDAAVPRMVNHNMTATLYLTTGFVGATTRWLRSIGEGDRPMMSWDQVRVCHGQGIEIGGHTITHPALDLLPVETASLEISGCKAAIEREIGAAVTSFAYPFGFFNHRVRSLVADAGYRSACAVNYETSGRHEDPLQLSRLIVRNGCSPEQLLEIIRGQGDRLTNLKDRMRSKIWRSLRRLPSGVLQ